MKPKKNGKLYGHNKFESGNINTILLQLFVQMIV